MDTTAMEYFMEIAAGETFWEVSENRHISQSSVSKSVSRLEDELGVKLFSREKRSVRLTPAGEIFYEALKAIEPQFQEALCRMAKYSSMKKISCYVVPNTDFLELGLRIQNSHFAEKYPDISLSLLRQEDPDTALQDLLDEKIDFIIGHRFSDTVKLCDTIPVYNDILYAILPRDHPLADREQIDFMELYHDHFMIRSTTMRKTLKEICAALKCPLPPDLTLFDVPSSQLRRDHLISRISFGQGITIYFKSDTYPFKLDHVRAVPVTGCPEFPIAISKKKGTKLNIHQEVFQRYICDTIFTDKNY